MPVRIDLCRRFLSASSPSWCFRWSSFDAAQSAVNPRRSQRVGEGATRGRTHRQETEPARRD
jgi:hypothetical protein